MNTSMRDAFLDELYDIALRDRRVLLLSNDFGAPSLDKFREDCARQFIHIGIAEENMVDLAAGLAMAGKIVYMYSIAPFLPMRCYEQIRIHMGLKGFHITGVVVGAGFSYALSGTTHQALEDIAMMNALPNMTVLTASDSAMGKVFARMTYETSGPKYIRFDREKFPTLYSEKEDFTTGLGVLKEGKDLTIVATGIMTHRALEVTKTLAGNSIDAGVVDLYRIKPLNDEKLLKTAKKSGYIVTLEENFINSGIGSIISNLVTDQAPSIKVKRLGIPDKYFPPGRSRAMLHELCGLDTQSITQNILKWLK